MPDFHKPGISVQRYVEKLIMKNTILINDKIT